MTIPRHMVAKAKHVASVQKVENSGVEDLLVYIMCKFGIAFFSDEQQIEMTS